MKVLSVRVVQACNGGMKFKTLELVRVLGAWSGKCEVLSVRFFLV